MENQVIITKEKLTDFEINLNDLYAEKKQINVHLSDKPFVFTVSLKNRLDEYDCKISSFGANLWFRTKLGTTAKKYSSVGTLQNSIIRTVKEYVDFNGEISFSLSDEIYHI